jgi:cell division protein FtsZ
VIGVGRCGRNAVEHLIKSGVTGVECIFANADGDAVNPALHEMVAAISGAKVLFIVAGLGGHTGGAYANLIASAAREMGIHTFGVVFTPFEFEGQRRIARAVASLRLLNESLNMMTVVSNDRLLALGENVSQEAAFSMANEVLINAVRGMVDIAAEQPRLTTSEGFFRVLRTPGRALIGCVSAVGPFRAGIAIARALECPLVAEQDLFNAKAVLILLVAAEKSLELGEFLHARNIILAQ